MREHSLQRSQRVPVPPETAFDFYGDALNLEPMTPPWIHFRVTSPGPITMGAGTLLDYSLRLHGFPVRWRTKIETWEPPHRFTDTQLRGPYALWHHQHTFEPTDHGTVLCSDHVTYKLPGGPLGRIGQPLMVKRQLLEIFRFRRGVIGKRLGGIQPLADVEIRRA